MLGFGLAATGLVGLPAEFLNFDTSFLGWRRRLNQPTPTSRGAVGMFKRRVLGDPEWWRCYHWSPESMLAYLDAVVTVRTAPSGVFALKAHAYQFDAWRQKHGFDPERWGVPVRWVHLRRVDVVAQAVSYVIAIDSKRWSKVPFSIEPRVGQPTIHNSVAPQYSAHRIAAAVRQMTSERELWATYFRERGIEPVTFTYEHLVDNYEGAVRATIELLGMQVDEVLGPRTERQAASINRDWIDRFVVDRPDLAASARSDA